VIARRTFIAALGGSLLGLPCAAVAQQPSRMPRIGYVSLSMASGDPRPRDAFLQGLRDLGYAEGKNVLIEYRDAEGKTERFGALAADLVALKVDVIVTGGGTLGALAAQQATTTIPIVFGAVGDPVGEGLVASLARPGGNVTGLSVNSPELASKSLELLKQTVPGMTRVALLMKPDAMPDRARKDRLELWDGAARALGVRLQVVEARRPEDFYRAFADMTKARADALTVIATPLFDTERRRLVELATARRLPTVYTFRPYVEAGGLMSYGPDLSHLGRRAAGYVDRILKGAKPGDLPVEQPTKFELVINLKTAKALGLTIPPSLLQRADQLIE
jgi:putative tryptophan/tyrosine transport system substrate-binding protein